MVKVWRAFVASDENVETLWMRIGTCCYFFIQSFIYFKCIDLFYFVSYYFMGFFFNFVFFYMFMYLSFHLLVYLGIWEFCVCVCVC